MANELRDEAFRVPRGEGERALFATLLAEISSALGEDPQPSSPGSMEDPWRWLDGLREQSRARWNTILGDDFARLHPDSQGDLVRADVTYHGAVDDLGRSAHLLALTLERELRERVAPPFRAIVAANRASFPRSVEWSKLLGENPPPTLGELLSMISSTREPSVRALFETTLPPGALDTLMPVVTFARNIPPVVGESINITEVRNAVAHGRTLATPLDRLAVDAIKRAFMLDAPVVLKGLQTWPLADAQRQGGRVDST